MLQSVIVFKRNKRYSWYCTHVEGSPGASLLFILHPRSPAVETWVQYWKLKYRLGTLLFRIYHCVICCLLIVLQAWVIHVQGNTVMGVFQGSKNEVTNNLNRSLFFFQKYMCSKLCPYPLTFENQLSSCTQTVECLFNTVWRMWFSIKLLK